MLRQRSQTSSGELRDVRVVNDGATTSPERAALNKEATPTNGTASPRSLGKGQSSLDDAESVEEEEEEEWYVVARDGLFRRWNLALGVILVALTAWFANKDVGGKSTWKYTGLTACALLGRSTSRWFVMLVVYVLENMLPLDKVAYYFDALSPALTTFLWYAGVAVMWGFFFAAEIHGETYTSAIKVLALFGLWLLSRCVASLIVKMLTANLHAGTFWTQLKTTVRHEVMLRNLTGAPTRPRPSAKNQKSIKTAMKRSSSFSKGKPRSKSPPGSIGDPQVEAVKEHARTESGASDSFANEQELKAIHANLSEGITSAFGSQTESDEGVPKWDSEQKNQNMFRMAEDQAKALATQAMAVMGARSVRSKASDAKDFSLFNSLSLMKPVKKDTYMTHYVSAERVMERAKMTLGMGETTSETDVEMRRASKLIFNHIRRPGEKFITKEAVSDFLPSRDVDEAMCLLSGQENFTFAAVGFQDLCRGIRRMFDERLLLGQTLQSMQGLAETLGRSLQAIFFAIVFVIGLFLFNVDVGSLWILFSSSVLALTFIFGSSASRAFEAAMMIFTVHPFNIGDWIVVNQNNFKVLSIGINSTKLCDLMGEIVYMPTAQLANQPIVNLSRSGELWMKVGLLVDIGITQSQCTHLQNIVLKFISSDKRNYAGPCHVALRNFAEERLKVELNVLYSLAFNGSERLRMIESHSRMISVVQSALIDMGVTFTGTDGMIFCHNPETLETALEGLHVAAGVPVADTAPSIQGATANVGVIPTRAPAPRNVDDAFGRYPPHTSYWRSGSMQQPYAMNSSLRHLSGMLKMD